MGATAKRGRACRVVAMGLSVPRCIADDSTARWGYFWRAASGVSLGGRRPQRVRHEDHLGHKHLFHSFAKLEAKFEFGDFAETKSAKLELVQEE